MTDPTPDPPSWNDLLDALRRCVHQLENQPRNNLIKIPIAGQHGRALLDRVDVEMRAAQKEVEEGAKKVNW